jgi:hypothetical protein
VPVPIQVQHVERFVCYPHKDKVGGWVRLTSGFDFWYDRGYVTGFESPYSYLRLDADERARFKGPFQMSAKEAIQLAHDSLRKLGYSETTLYANGAPKVTRPFRGLPRYAIA